MDENDEINFGEIPEEREIDFDCQTVVDVGDELKVDGEMLTVKKFTILETEDGVVRFPILEAA